MVDVNAQANARVTLLGAEADLPNTVSDLLLSLTRHMHGAIMSHAPGGRTERRPAMPGLERITFNPHIMGGQACIRGMRLPVSLLVGLVADGMRDTEILTEYPDLEPEDIHQALRYAAWLANERVVPAGAVSK